MPKNSISELCNSVNLVIYPIGTAYYSSSNIIRAQQEIVFMYMYIVAILLKLNVSKLILNI